MEIAEQVNQALKFVKERNYISAEKIYLELLEEYSENHIILSFLGYLYLETKKYKKAEQQFEKAYSINQTETILSGLALIKYTLRKYEQAVPLYIELIKQKPTLDNYIRLTDMLASFTVVSSIDYAPKLYEYCKQGIEKFPLSKNILLNFSIANLYLGHFVESEKCLADCFKQDKKFPKAWSQAGLIQECLYCNEDEAQKCYKNAIKYSGGTLSEYYDLGVSYSKSCKYNLATKYFKKALKLSPKNNTIILGIAHNYFKQRKFKEGFKYYIKQNDSSAVRKLKNIWDGKNHKDKTIFVFPDLAYGDHIMFMRYVPFLKTKFKSVKVFVYPNLKRLFETNFDVEFVTKIPKYDYSVALSKLPYYLGMDFQNIPFSDKYIDVPQQSGIKSNKLKVGLCWEAGNSDLRTTIHRSININEFAKLFEQDYEFYSFQVGASNNEIKKYPIVDLGKDFKDFYDTASYLKSMDIIVTVDTSVANLSGAMGLNTLMLLPYYPDWRWFDNDNTTEWYKSVSIYKQQYKNSWKSEIDRIIAKLTELKNK